MLEPNWKGKPLSDYTKDELIGILKKVINSYENHITRLLEGLRNGKG